MRYRSSESHFGVKWRSRSISILRIPRKLDGRSMANWTPVPRQSGQLERRDARGRNYLLWGGFLRQCRLKFAQGLAGQSERMGVVDQAIEDGIGQGRMAEGLVPVGHG